MNIKIALTLISATIILTACSSQSTVAGEQSKIPLSLQVPRQQTMLFSAFGRGVQIYICEAKANKQYKWTLKAPEAVLLDPKTGKQVGKHYAGPTWEASDGSKVVGQVKNMASATNAKDIPWLLLTAKSQMHNGVFSNINYIQRVDTTRGSAPVAGCDSYHVGQEARVNYTANYYFFGAENKLH